MIHYQTSPSANDEPSGHDESENEQHHADSHYTGNCPLQGEVGAGQCRLGSAAKGHEPTTLACSQWNLLAVT